MFEMNAGETDLLSRVCTYNARQVLAYDNKKDMDIVMNVHVDLKIKIQNEMRKNKLTSFTGITITGIKSSEKRQLKGGGAFIYKDVKILDDKEVKKAKELKTRKEVEVIKQLPIDIRKLIKSEFKDAKKEDAYKVIAKLVKDWPMYGKMDCMSVLIEIEKAITEE